MRKKIFWALAIFFIVSFIYADWYYNPQTGMIDYTIFARDATVGNILYYDGENWQVLARGANMEVLTLATGMPSWAAAGAPGAHAATHAGGGADPVDHDTLLNYVAGQHLVLPGTIVATLTDHNLAAHTALGIIDMANVFYISATGGDYATIQGALTAQAGGGEVFIVGPGTYAADTINFSANDQTVRGYGLTPNVHITQVDATVCNFGAHTGCRIENMHLEMTAPTTAKDLITGSGSLRIRWCHLEVTNAAVATADQPTCLDTTGNVIMTFGTVEYANTGDDAGGATAIKAAVRISGSADVEFRRVRFIITGAGQSLAIAPSYGTAGVVTMVRCLISVDDDASSNSVGFAYSNVAGGVHEFMGNDLHVDNANNAAVGIWALSSENIRSMFNHIHVTTTGGTADSFNIAGAATITSQFDDIIAANGTAGAGTLVIVSSEVDGNLTISGDATIDDVVVDKIEANESFTFDAVQTATGDGTTTVDWGLGNNMYFTFGAQNDTFTFTAPPGVAKLILILKQDGVGSRIPTWPGTVLWPGNVAPTLSTTAAYVDIISFLWDGTNYFGLFNGDFR